MIKIFFLSTILLLLLLQELFGGEIRGTIKNDKSELLHGVSVFTERNIKGAVTENVGNYHILNLH